MSREYYSSGRISQSKLKYFIDCKEKYHGKYIVNAVQNDDTASMGFGRYYHTLILQPEKINEVYSLDTGLKVEGMMGVFIEEYAKTQDKEASYIKAGFKWSIEKVWENFEKEENQKYYKFLLDTTGKELISKDDFHKGNQMLQKFNSNAEVFHLLNPIGTGLEIYTELIIEWNVNFCKLELQSMLDRVIINNNMKTIKILDLKTTRDYNLKGFTYSIKKYRYDVQAIFYINALMWYIDNNPEWNKYKDYDISFVFVPQCTEFPHHCLKPCDIDSSDLDKAYLEYREALVELETCMLLNDWTSDSNKTDLEGIVTIKLSV